MLLDCSLGRREMWCVPVIGLLQVSRPGKSLRFTIWCKSKLKMRAEVKDWSCSTACQNPPGFPGAPRPRAPLPSAAPRHCSPSPPSCRERNGSGRAGKSHWPGGTCRDCGQAHGTLGDQDHPPTLQSWDLGHAAGGYQMFALLRLVSRCNSKLDWDGIQLDLAW